MSHHRLFGSLELMLEWPNDAWPAVWKSVVSSLPSSVKLMEEIGVS